ncbi:hypothetical protein IFM89_006297 [Coptis chinensis]|uniref:Root cap n=1 Tax=Coptis chinensis TaxID=261450 RepID=A0A835GXJ3_9MAGN|nr:hypothetical protein IFM89_006297 [Coptis chinensis]
MKFFSRQCIVVILLLFVSGVMSVTQQHVTCTNHGSKCFLQTITCPAECPQVQPATPKVKGCFLDCNSPKCEAVCRNRKANCNSPGAACFDPRFVGGDGIVFYFHGRSNQHFSLISDPNLQINARFIGHRPNGRTRDYTWIQALGVMFDFHTFSVEAKKVEKWNDEVDQLQFTYDGKALEITEDHLSTWQSPKQEIKVERTSNMNSVTVTLTEYAEILINVVPITEQDDKIHNYQIPSNDCFAHLELQFRFIGLSPDVEGVLGRTYRPDFVNPAKPGVAMPVVGGEDKHKTTSLLSSDCASCLFSPGGVETKGNSIVMDFGTLDCGQGFSGGNGIVCRK